MIPLNETGKAMVLRLSAALAKECETGQFRTEETSPDYIAWLLRLLIEIAKEKP
jgi:hypothetical protein